MEKESKKDRGLKSIRSHVYFQLLFFIHFLFGNFSKNFVWHFLLARAQQWLQSAEISRLINSDRWGEIIGKSDGVLWPICESCEKLFFSDLRYHHSARSSDQLVSTAGLNCWWSLKNYFSSLHLKTASKCLRLWGIIRFFHQIKIFCSNGLHGQWLMRRERPFQFPIAST